MSQVSVLINCPGGWSHGLDSPERGESRWAQNLAKLLARSGEYKVFATSGGNPTWGRGEVFSNVTLLSEPDADKGTYDIYIDSSWYEGKSKIGTAKAYIHTYWTPFPWMFEKMPHGHFITYVYRQLEPEYMVNENLNRDVTYYLPATFGKELVKPNPSARRVISFSRYADEGKRFSNLYKAVDNLRSRYNIEFVWLDQQRYPRPTHKDDVALTHPPNEPWGIPYCELLKFVNGAGINASFGGGGSIADCAVYGVPSLICTDNFSMLPDLMDAAKSNNVLMSYGFDSAEIEDTINRLYSDSELYNRYTFEIQEVYRDHVDDVVMMHWKKLVEAVL